MKYKCPVCLADTLDRLFVHCSYDICSNCGVEYGYDDYVDHENLAKLQPLKHAELREAYIKAGSPNWTEETKQPDFTYGVGWLKDYYSDPVRREIWENDLASMGNYLRRMKKRV